MTNSAFSRRQLLAAGLLAPLARVGVAQRAAGPIVETAHGKVQGIIDQRTLVFRGLPYGAPTGGANRFRPPQPVQGWTGVRGALLFGSSSPQTNPAGSTMPASFRAAVPSDPVGVAEDEDCLVLNVWTPGVTGRRPVMVWLHGGGFSSGSASSILYDGGNLARRGDVVMVGVNHRLNVFGYTHLATFGGPEFRYSGNAGMLDIVQALLWIRDNIASFGGDPDNVTIFGESGGGAKVSILLSMASAKGLFHRAIIQSGPGLRVGLADQAENVGAMLMTELGLALPALPTVRMTGPGCSACSSTPGLASDLVRRLQQVPAADLLKAYFALQPKLGGSGPGSTAFSPVLDGFGIARHPFDPDAPAISHDVPLLIGCNRTEATLFLRGTAEDRALDEPGLVRRVRAAFPKGDATALIRAYRDGNPGATPWDLFVLMSGDQMVGANSILLAERKAARGGAPVYVYRFDWETRAMGGHMKACHGVEVPFVFDNTVRAPGIVGTDDNTEPLASNTADAWIAFARGGKPAAAGLPEWPAYSANQRKVMLLNNESRVADDPGGHERRVLLAALS